MQYILIIAGISVALATAMAGYRNSVPAGTFITQEQIELIDRIMGKYTMWQEV